MKNRAVALLVLFLVGVSATMGTAQTTQTQIAGNTPGFVFPSPTPALSTGNLTMCIRLAWQNESSLQTLLATLQNPASPQFHQFLSQSAFIQTYAPSQKNVQALISWLQNQGFSVSAYTYPSMFINFTGTVAQAEAAFQIKIVEQENENSRPLYENTANPLLPSNLAGLVEFISGLDNITPVESGSPCPTSTPSPAASPSPIQGNHLRPQDLYTYYNEPTPTVTGNNGGTTNDAIGIIALSDFSDQAFSAFCTAYSLPNVLPTRVYVGTINSSGTLCSFPNYEVSLDTEWSHAVAPNTPQIVYEYDASDKAGQLECFDAAVQANVCGVISCSIGPLCQQDPARFWAYDQIFQQASAQGQTVFVSAGDQGAGGYTVNSTCLECLVGGSGQRSINEIAGSPNVTAVGGTQFVPTYDENGNDTSVVGQTTETVWNQSPPTSQDISTIPQLVGSGGISGDFSRPTWQTPLQNLGNYRLIPDVSMVAGLFDKPGLWIFDIDSNGTAVQQTTVGGTSIATPMWAAISRLVANAAGTTRLGNINPVLYSQSNGGNSITGLVDITEGNNTYQTPASCNGTATGPSVTGFTASTGYDVTTGWGVPNIAVFVPSFAKAMTSTAVGATVNAGATVTTDGQPGQTVSCPTFTIGNTTTQTESVASVSVSISNPALFQSVQMVAASNGVTQTVTAQTVASVTKFAFATPLSIAPGGKASFSVFLTLTSASAARSGSLAGGVGVFLILGACMLWAPKRLRVSAVICVGTLVWLIGCNNGGGNQANGGAAMPSVQPPAAVVGTSTQSVQAGGVSVTNATGPVNVGGLPITLGIVQLVH